MKDSEFYEVLHSIVTWEHITSLDLSNKDIDDKQAIELAAALVTNPFIKEINLSHNRITELGTNALLQLKRKVNLESNLINMQDRGDNKIIKEHDHCTVNDTMAGTDIKKDNSTDNGLESTTQTKEIHFPKKSELLTSLLKTIAIEIKAKISDTAKKISTENEALEKNLKTLTLNILLKKSESCRSLSAKNIDKLFCDLAIQYKQNNKKLTKLLHFPHLVSGIQIEQKILLEIMSYFAENLIPELPRCKPRHITNIFCSLAVLGYKDAKLIQALSFRVLEDMSSFSPQNLIRIAWAYASLGEQNEDLFEKMDAYLACAAPRISWRNKYKVVQAFRKVHFNKPLQMLPEFLNVEDSVFLNTRENEDEINNFVKLLQGELNRQQEKTLEYPEISPTPAGPAPTEPIAGAFIAMPPLLQNTIEEIANITAVPPNNPMSPILLFRHTAIDNNASEISLHENPTLSPQ